MRSAARVLVGLVLAVGCLFSTELPSFAAVDCQATPGDAACGQPSTLADDQLQAADGRWVLVTGLGMLMCVVAVGLGVAGSRH